MCGGGCRVEGKGVEPKEPKGHQLVVEVVASREQRISRIKMAKKEIKLAWAQKMAAKEALVVKLQAAMKIPKIPVPMPWSLDWLPWSPESTRAGFFEQSTAGRREGQVTAVMVAAVEGPVGAQVTAGSWNKRMEKICYM